MDICSTFIFFKFVVLYLQIVMCYTPIYKNHSFVQNRAFKCFLNDYCVKINSTKTFYANGMVKKFLNKTCFRRIFKYFDYLKYQSFFDKLYFTEF